MLNINELYQELIIDHGTSPRNFFFLENSNHTGEGFNHLCGDQITLFLLVKDQIIIQAAFQGQGCAISTASASIMTELLINNTVPEALKLYENFVNKLTNKQPNIKEFEANDQLPEKLLALLGVKNYPARVKCATLAWHTLDSALNYKLNHKEDNKVSES